MRYTNPPGHPRAPRVESRRERGARYLRWGAGLGALSAGSVAVLGVVACPLCIVACPAMLAYGAWERSRPDAQPEDDTPAPRDETTPAAT